MSPRARSRSLPPEGAAPSLGAARREGGPATDTLIDERSLSRLKWRSRRGLLENDLFVERFFRSHEAALTERNLAALQALMDLADNDLLDLFLCRREPQGSLDCAAVHEVLALIRTDPMTERQ